MKAKELKTKINEKFEKAKYWAETHEAEIFVGSIVLMGFTRSTMKYLNKRRAYMEKYLYIYDRSLDYYVPLRRRLTKKELLYLNRRHQMGETVTSILNDMGLIK